MRDEAKNEASFDRLSSVIADELTAQLAMAAVTLDREYIEGIANMVADEVLDSFEVEERTKPRPR